jgi:hypothetical protein
MTALPRSARRPAVPMILPEFERASGEVSRRLFLRDARIPRPFGFDRPPVLVGFHDRSELCPDGRHLWDAIVAQGECQVDDDDREHLPFRLTLTCVRCGRLERLAGVTNEEERRFGGHVDPEPIAAGGLRAQQVTEAGDVVPTWHVFATDGKRVGTLQTAVTRRGRRYVEGRLDERSHVTEAATAIACLRKLAKTFGDAG